MCVCTYVGINLHVCSCIYSFLFVCQHTYNNGLYIQEHTHNVCVLVYIIRYCMCVLYCSCMEERLCRILELK